MERITKNKKYDFGAFKIPLNANRRLKARNKTIGVEHSKKLNVREVEPKKPAVKKTTLTRNQRTIL